MSVNPGSLTDSSKITLQIGNEKLSGFSGLQVSLGIDTGANAFSFTVPWVNTPENIDRFKPFRPDKVFIRIDGELILTGYIDITSWTISEGQNLLNVQGRSASAPIVDYSAGPPFQFQDITFNDFGREMWKAVGGTSGGAVAIAIPDTDKISEISIDPGETLYDVVSKLASANGLWAIPTPTGELSYQKIKSTSISVATLEEGKGPVKSVTSSADITKRFQKYMVIGTFDGNPESTAEISDPETFGLAIRGRKIVPLSQQTTDMDQAARFLRSTALIDSYSASCEVEGWHYNGNLWKPGTIMTLKAPSAYINKPSRFMIRNVTLQLDESGGQIAGLELSIPEAYDGTEPKALPWQ